MNREEHFLDLFKKLEQYLRINYSDRDYSYTGFITKLYQIKKSKETFIINNNRNFEIIKLAAQIRNIVSHNNDILIPSEKFTKDFEEIVNKITKPLTVRQIMTRYDELKTCGLKTTIGDVVEMLNKSGFSTIPVIEGEDLIGLFTEKSLYDYLSLKSVKKIDKAMKIEEMIEAIDLNNHPRKYFEFVDINRNIYDAYQIFNRDIKQRREMLLLLVTHNGIPGEHLLGIVALRDLEKQLIN